MDTHIAGHNRLDPEDPVLSARLPGEVGGAIPNPDGRVSTEQVAPEPGQGLSRSGTTRVKRHALLLGAAAVSLGAAAVSAFLVSPYNHVYPVPRMTATVQHLAASAGITSSPPLAPSAALANVTVPPAPPPVVREHYAAKPKDQQIREVLAFGTGAPPGGPTQPAADTADAPAQAAAGRPAKVPESAEPHSAPPRQQPTTAASAAPSEVPAMPVNQPKLAHDAVEPPPGYVPSEPGTTPLPLPVSTREVPAVPGLAHSAETPPHAAPPPNVAVETISPPSTAPAPTPVHDMTETVLSSLSPAARPRAEAAPTPSEPAPAHAVDPIAIGGQLYAAPMTPPDQVQVLNLVTEMATMVRDLRTQVGQLRSDVQKGSAADADRLADFERRLALAEARNAIAVARDATEPSPPAAPSPTPGSATPIILTRAPAGTPESGSRQVRRYRVQAASPGLALLAEIDRGGGDGAQLQVVAGDSIPGYGRIKSIAQRGTTWIVMTENGPIQ